MVFFWSFLNSALKPRVFWVVCHHIELPDRSDDIWTYLRDGLKDLLITRPTETSKRQQENRIEASRKGKMGPEVVTPFILCPHFVCRAIRYIPQKERWEKPKKHLLLIAIPKSP